MDDERQRENHDEIELPELPPIPELPQAPKLKPTLPPDPNARTREEPSQYQQTGIAWSIPAALITPILLLTLGGAWLDTRFHKSPLFTLFGALLGMAAGVTNMVRMANKLNRD